jgi:hypothetical protein
MATDSISGVEGRRIYSLLAWGGPMTTVQKISWKNFRDLGTDCSTFMFSHSDLRSGSIFVNPVDRSVEIIDWETADLSPRNGKGQSYLFQAGWIYRTMTKNGGKSRTGQAQRYLYEE